MFSISYVPSGGDFAGQDCAFWKGYGEPHVFDSYQLAAEFIKQQPPCWRHLDMKVISLATALRLSAEMAEVYSGRCKVAGYRRVVVNEARPDYARVMGRLISRATSLIKRRPQIPLAERIQRLSSGNSEPSSAFIAD
jgi:hypothetical protein